MGPFPMWLKGNQRPAVAVGPLEWKAARLSAWPGAVGSGVRRDARAPAAVREAKGREESAPGRGCERWHSRSGKQRYKCKWSKRRSSPSAQVQGLVMNRQQAAQELSWVLLTAGAVGAMGELPGRCNAWHFWNFTFGIKLAAVCKTSWNVLGFDTLGFYGDLKKARLEWCVGQVDTLRASLCRPTLSLRT